MKLTNVKPSLTQTKNPLYFQLGIRVDGKIKEEAGLSHEGMAFAVVAKDELKALMGVGFKPFARGELEVDFREEPNEDPQRPTLLRFDLLGAEFSGGMGSWDTILDAPVREKPAAQPNGDARPF